MFDNCDVVIFVAVNELFIIKYVFVSSLGHFQKLEDIMPYNV